MLAPKNTYAKRRSSPSYHKLHRYEPFYLKKKQTHKPTHPKDNLHLCRMRGRKKKKRYFIERKPDDDG
jgi:hypothetical protein